MDLKVLNMQENAKLTQLDKHQTGMAEVPGSILTGGNIMLLIFLYSHRKPLVAILPVSSSL